MAKTEKEKTADVVVVRCITEHNNCFEWYYRSPQAASAAYGSLTKALKNDERFCELVDGYGIRQTIDITYIVSVILTSVDFTYAVNAALQSANEHAEERHGFSRQQTGFTPSAPPKRSPFSGDVVLR